MPHILNAKRRNLVVPLTADGTSTGSSAINVNGASTAVEFWYQCPTTLHRFEVHRIIFTYSDAGGAWAYTGFGRLAALSTGCDLVYTCHDSTTYDFTPGNIKSNIDWSRMMYDTTVTNWSGNDQTLSGRFSFDRFGPPLILVPDGGISRLSLHVNDDLTGLNSFEVFAEGSGWMVS